MVEPFSVGLTELIGRDNTGSRVYKYLKRNPTYAEIVKTHCGIKYRMFREKWDRRIVSKLNPSGKDTYRMCKFDMVINEKRVGMTLFFAIANF